MQHIYMYALHTHTHTPAIRAQHTETMPGTAGRGNAGAGGQGNVVLAAKRSQLQARRHNWQLGSAKMGKQQRMSE